MLNENKLFVYVHNLSVFKNFTTFIFYVQNSHLINVNQRTNDNQVNVIYHNWIHIKRDLITSIFRNFENNKNATKNKNNNLGSYDAYL